jgi:hypothetical protein
MVHFGEALAWALARRATWRFKREGPGCVLTFEVEGAAPIVLFGASATDWGWLFVEAVVNAQHALADTRPPGTNEETESDRMWND